MAMTLREWSLSLGLLSPEEDRIGLWATREIGQPKDTEGSNADEAWNLIGAENADPFKTSVSTREEITDPVLRLTHVFLAHNLLGQANTTITMIELYFMWCMLKEVKVHLGYWLAHACHKIARHPVRHLYACHLLGAYLIRNIFPRLAIPKSSIVMCEDPEWFDISYFIHTGIVKKKGPALVFYEAGRTKEAREEVESEEDDALEEAEETPIPSEERLNLTETGQAAIEEKWQRIMKHMLHKFGEANEMQRGLFELQTENMTKALSLMERMTILAEKNSQMAQQLISSASVSRESQPQEANLDVTPDITPVRVMRKRKDTTTTTNQPPTEEARPRSLPRQLLGESNWHVRSS